MDTTVPLRTGKSKTPGDVKQNTMESVALHFTIAEGKRDAYLEAHDPVPEEIETAYRNAGADLQKERVFEQDGHVFVYFEVGDPERLLEFLAESEVIASWNERMKPYLEETGQEIYEGEVADTEDAFMQEIYRID